MKIECIYVDEDKSERILYIDELVTIEYENGEIHYMNNNSMLFRNVRKASQEHRLFCTCGCGSCLQLVAGEKSVTTKRFFRNYADFTNNNCCYDESLVTQKSKILLRTWLNQILNVGLLNDIAIAEINKGNRKYELTYYSQEYDFGLVYANEAKNIAYEKIQEIDEYKEMNIMYISDVHNKIQSGQLPLHQIDIQDKQGFCIFLQIENPEKDEFMLSNARLVCTYYIKQHIDNGVWVGLPILEDSILEFSVSPKGKLLYKNVAVDIYKEQVQENYIKKEKERQCKEELERKLAEEIFGREQERLEQERIKKEEQTQRLEQARIEQEKRLEQARIEQEKNRFKIKIKNIIEKRLYKYSEIEFEMKTDWLEEITVDGNKCIMVDLDKLEDREAAILGKMQLYTGQRQSIERVGNQIVFKGYT